MSDTKKYTFELLKVKPMSGVNKRQDPGFLDDVFEKTVKKYGLKNPIPKKKMGGSIKKYNKGTKLKDILGDKKGTVVYKGKNKGYRMTIPVAPKPKKG
jgi:phage terminase large subunit